MCAPCSGESAHEFYDSIGRSKDDVCPQCGHRWGEGSTFCPMCGYKKEIKLKDITVGTAGANR